MTRQEILTAIRPFFDIDELVCDHTYAKWGEEAWQFLDTNYLHALLIIRRDIIKMPCQIRIEKGVSWLHFDVRPDDTRPDVKVVEFDA